MIKISIFAVVLVLTTGANANKLTVGTQKDDPIKICSKFEVSK